MHNKQPNPKVHQTISFIKSGVRIVACLTLPYHIVAAASLLLLAEIVGIIEELA